MQRSKGEKSKTDKKMKNGEKKKRNEQKEMIKRKTVGRWGHNGEAFHATIYINCIIIIIGILRGQQGGFKGKGESPLPPSSMQPWHA